MRVLRVCLQSPFFSSPPAKRAGEDQGEGGGKDGDSPCILGQMCPPPHPDPLPPCPSGTGERGLYKQALKTIIIILVFALLQMPQAQAEIAYSADPPYKKLNPADSSPMMEMHGLAKGGDLRAMYILGNLYAKGQGGLPKDLDVAQEWFEKSAMQGYAQSFLRLAALAKRAKKPIEAYKWYTLAVDNLDAAWQDRARLKRDSLVLDTQLTSSDKDQAHRDANLWTSEMRKVRRLAEERKEAAQNKKKSRDPKVKPPSTSRISQRMRNMP